MQLLGSEGLPATSDGDGGTVASNVATGRLTDYVVSHGGRSQYNRAGGGVSACGLAALNCARVILGLEREGLDKEQLIQRMTSRELLEVSLLPPCRIASSVADRMHRKYSDHVSPGPAQRTWM